MKMNLMKYLTNLFFATFMTRVTDGDAGGDSGEGDTPPAEGDTPPAEGNTPPAEGDTPPKDSDADANKGDEGNPKSDADDVNAVPETYADFTMPEGMGVDTQALEHYAPILKDAGLSQENAQKLVTAQAELTKARDVQAAADYQATVDGWAGEVKADKELGGDNYDATLQHSATALDKLGSPELNDFLDTYGIGSNPHLVRFFAKVGSMVSEDTPSGSGTPSEGKPKTQAEIMYPLK